MTETTQQQDPKPRRELTVITTDKKPHEYTNPPYMWFFSREERMLYVTHQQKTEFSRFPYESILKTTERIIPDEQSKTTM